MGIKRKVAPPKPLWEQHAGKLILVSSSIAALVSILHFSQPIINSHLPSASQDELLQVKVNNDSVTSNLLNQIKSLDARQNDSVQRGAIVAKSLRDLRMTALRTEIDKLKDATDEVSRKLRAQDEQELSELMEEK